MSASITDISQTCIYAFSVRRGRGNTLRKGLAMSGETFKVGDTVVEPTIGVCRIQGVRSVIIDGATEEYFIFQAPNAQVLVPKSQVVKRGVRKPMSKDDIKKVTTMLKAPVATHRGDAREEYLEYQDILRSGNPTRISQLLRRLFILAQSDDLKGKEKELMEQARRFLVDEITFIQGESKTKILGDINEALRSMYKKKVKKERELARPVRK